jgi:hypothetical protein
MEINEKTDIRTGTTTEKPSVLMSGRALDSLTSMPSLNLISHLFVELQKRYAFVCIKKSQILVRFASLFKSAAIISLT